MIVYITPRAQPAATRIVGAAALILFSVLPARVQEPVAFSIQGADFLGDAPGAVTAGVGAFNAISREGEPVAGEFRLEYRLGEKWNFIGPLAGVLATTEGGVFGYAAAYSDIRIAEQWYLTPAGGIGAYGEGEGKDLGGVFQFHLGVDFAYRFENGHRLGFKVTHVSNAFIHDRNPGVESVLVTYTLPLGP